MTTRRSRLPGSTPSADERGGKFSRGSGGKGSGSKGRASQEAVGDIKADPQLKKLLAVLTTQTLRNTQDMRMVKGATFDTFMAKAEHPVIKAVKEERERYVSTQKSDDPVSYGPAVPMFQALLDALITQDIGQSNKKTLSEDADRLFETSVEEVEQYVHGVYLEKAHDTTMTKLVIGMHPYPHRHTIISALKQLDFKYMPGRAPPGYMENQLGQWLEKLSLD